jgi:rubrerythrin
MLLRRRHILKLFLLAPMVQLFKGKPAQASAGYQETIVALKEGYQAETNAHRRYVLFGRLARESGYKGIAYLYTSLATSEKIHADNYRRVLNAMGTSVVEPPKKEIPIGSTKENLIYAAERELNSINNAYPAILDRIGSEGHTEAINAVEYSWSSHKQHLDIINKIRRWSPSFFETVARKIDEKTDRYFVCEICGSTVTETPKDVCPICQEAATSYRLVSPEEFAGLKAQ